MEGTAVKGEAELCGRFQQSAFDLAYRITGSEADAAAAVQRAFLDAMPELPQLAGDERSFGLHLLTATRNACHDLMGGRQPSRSNGTAPESQQEEVGAASMRLPEHQREALALCGLEELSYEEIAAVMESSRNSVAQLISRARINLSDELRGTALASVAAPSPECERALPLIAARDDGQLDAASRDAAWLDAHLAGCARCRLGVGVMEEARAAYRTWEPIAAPPWLLDGATAKAADLSAADLPGVPPAPLPRRRPQRRRLTLAAAMALLLLAGVTVVLAGSGPSATPAGPVAGAAPGPGIGASAPAKAGKATRGANAKKGKAKAPRSTVETSALETTPTPVPAPTQVLTGGGASGEHASGPNRPSGKTAVQPTRQTSAPKSGSKSKPAPAPTSASPSAPAQAAPETLPPAQESSKKEPSGQAKGHEPPGKATGRPPR